MKRPFRVWIAIPILFVLAASFVVGILLWQNTLLCAISIAVLAVGTPIYFIQRRRRKMLIQEPASAASTERSPLFKGNSEHSWTA